MLQKALGDLPMSQKNVYKWYKDFKEGRERVDELERPGRPSASADEQHVNQIKELVHKNRRLTIRALLKLLTFRKDHSTPFQKIFWTDNSWFLHHDNAPSLTLHSFFVTISPKTQRISFHNHHIHLFWLRVTSGYSPISKDNKQLGFTKHSCFLCEWDSRARNLHYVKKDWPIRSAFSIGQKNVIQKTILDTEKLVLPPCHI